MITTIKPPIDLVPEVKVGRFPEYIHVGFATFDNAEIDELISRLQLARAENNQRLRMRDPDHGTNDLPHRCSDCGVPVARCLCNRTDRK